MCPHTQLVLYGSVSSRSAGVVWYRGLPLSWCCMVWKPPAELGLLLYGTVSSLSATVVWYSVLPLSWCCMVHCPSSQLLLYGCMVRHPLSPLCIVQCASQNCVVWYLPISQLLLYGTVSTISAALDFSKLQTFPIVNLSVHVVTSN